METLCSYMRLILGGSCPSVPYGSTSTMQGAPLNPGEEQPRMSTSPLPLNLLETEIQCQSQRHKLGTRSPECISLESVSHWHSLRPSGRDPWYSQLWGISCTLSDLPDQMLFDWHWQLGDCMVAILSHLGDSGVLYPDPTSRACSPASDCSGHREQQPLASLGCCLSHLCGPSSLLCVDSAVCPLLGFMRTKCDTLL